MDVGIVVAVNVEVTVGASTVIDVVATVVVKVLVATVVVAVDSGAVAVHVWRGTGYLVEQKVTAGGKPFKTLATRPGSPPMHKGFGQDAQWARVAMLPSRMTLRYGSASSGACGTVASLPSTSRFLIS